jgi:alpha-L-rhamnosidase
VLRRVYPSQTSIHPALALIAALLLTTLSGQAQDTINGNAPFLHARWIGFGDPAVDHADSRFAFRKKLDLSSKPTEGRVRVTADARYILWVNGTFVGRGPVRGFPWAQPFDELDLAPFMRQGANWIAAEVYQFGPGSGAFGQSTKGSGVYAGTGRTGLLIEGELISADGKAVSVRTDATWQARRADWARPNAIPYLHGAFAYQECVDGRREPADWRISEDGDGWQSATVVAAPGDAPWTGFEPRGLKPMRETPTPSLPVVAAFTGINGATMANDKALTQLWRDETLEPITALPAADSEGWLTLTPPAGGFIAVTFDLGWNAAAFPHLEIRDARGGEVLDSGYGASLPKDKPPAIFAGACDRWTAPAGNGEWQAFLPRGYRYHTVKVRADHAVQLRVGALITHHDVGPVLSFECSDEGLTKAWLITDRTLRTSMLDAFVDNNWREATQWLHDGCAGAIGAWATYGDTALWRRLLWQAAQSARYLDDGAIHSMVACGPAYQRAVMPICDYSLHWLTSVEQYHAVTGDDALLREVLPAVRECVMRHVESGFTDEGLFIQPVGSKVHFDWVQRPWDKRPYSLTLNLTVLRALRSAAVVAAAAGDDALATHCERRASGLSEAVAKRFWSEGYQGWQEHIEPSEHVQREVIAVRPAGWLDDPWQKVQLNMSSNDEPTPCSRHGHALALLTQLGTADQQTAAAALLVAAFEPDNVNNNGMSPLWTDKIFGSLFESGRDSDAIRLLQASYGTWARNGALHWGEGFGPGAVAQLCGSSVNWLLSSYVLGIRPGKPGFSEAIFDPRAGSLTSAKGSIATPHGLIKVEWQRNDDQIDARVEAPAGVHLISPNPRVRLRGREQTR